MNNKRKSLKKTQTQEKNLSPTIVKSKLPKTTTKKSKLPWDGMRSDKKTEQFNLRLSEVELEKLRFISTHTPLSMQSFVRGVLMSAIDRKVNALLLKK